MTVGDLRQLAKKIDDHGIEWATVDDYEILRRSIRLAIATAELVQLVEE